jgi:hypothetical protein
MISPSPSGVHALSDAPIASVLAVAIVLVFAVILSAAKDPNTVPFPHADRTFLPERRGAAFSCQAPALLKNEKYPIKTHLSAQKKSADLSPPIF